ncbi:MAG: hypothetical protein AB7O66_06755 [Limisphaerales bacterium]
MKPHAFHPPADAEYTKAAEYHAGISAGLSGLPIGSPLMNPDRFLSRDRKLLTPGGSHGTFIPSMETSPAPRVCPEEFPCPSTAHTGPNFRRHRRGKRRGGVLLGLLALLLPHWVSRAELIYDNTTNYRSEYLSLPMEFGDEIDFFGTARTISNMSFWVLGEDALPPSATAQFRIYRNNGPLLPFDNIAIPTPGELLFESVDIPIIPGPQTLRITDIAVPVPTNVTWTVLFKGTGTEPGLRAGLQIYHPPTVGASFRDYWVRGDDGFELQLLDGGLSASFAARFEAIPDPPVIMTVTNTAEGAVVRVSGPIGTEHIVETSSDGRHWRTLGTIRLLTTSEGTYFDTSNKGQEERFYRLRRSPYPGSSVVLTEIRPTGQGKAVLSFSGPRNTSHILEASDDQKNWKAIDVIYLLFGVATFEDTIRPGANRYYRTSHPTGRGPVYLIRGIRRDADGSIVVAASGLPDLTPATVEATTDFKTWTPLGPIQFITPRAEFRDTTAAQNSGRVYRIRR